MTGSAVVVAPARLAATHRHKEKRAYPQVSLTRLPGEALSQCLRLFLLAFRLVVGVFNPRAELLPIPRIELGPSLHQGIRRRALIRCLALLILNVVDVDS